MTAAVPEYVACAAPECAGQQVHPDGMCLAHVDAAQLAATIERQYRPGADLDLRRTHLDGDRLESVLAAFEGRIGTAYLEGARFAGDVSFAGARFAGVADFRNAAFSGDALFGQCAFDADARFHEVFVGGTADFGGARFHGDTQFEDARFDHDTSFHGARFEAGAGFARARFAGSRTDFDAAFFADGGWFPGAEFAGEVRFQGAVFAGNADFIGVRFGREVELENTRFEASAAFDYAQFERPTRLGPFSADLLHLNNATFGTPVQIEAAAGVVSAFQTAFAADAGLRLRYARVTLDGVTSGGPLIVAAASEPFRVQSAQDEMRSRLDEAGLPDRDPVPAVLSMRAVDASQLVLVDIDLSDCRFTDAYNLDRLRLEGRSRFAGTPTWVRARSGPIPFWRYARRQTIVEEHTWRNARHRFPTDPSTVDLVPERPLEPERLATIYRQLRKALEDAKNEPGAADFYYGEMEMRRASPTTASGERRILALYWALSGYGLRSSRALLALVLLLVLTTAGFAAFGFGPAQRTQYQPVSRGGYEQVTVDGPRPGWAAAVDHSLDSATSLLRTPQEPPLTQAGKALEIALRLLGPLLLGLAVLAIRNRVKR